MKHLGYESSSIEAATTKNGGDPKGHGYGVFADELETTKLILTVDSCSEGVPSFARLGEARIVHIGQKISTRDFEHILHCFGDTMQYCMNEIHRKVCHKADEQEKRTEELVEAHLGKNQETHRLEFCDEEGSRGLAINNEKDRLAYARMENF